ncbi:MAG: hypothetical protein J2P29_08650 [Actinobacteria bacterium]|nr:hypothetical protein [Actinomycetota bacterium]
MKATYRLLMADKWMVGLLLAGTLAAVATMAVIMVPAWYFGHVTPFAPSGGLAGYGVFVGAMWAASFVAIFVTGAVVAAAMIRADGAVPTMRAALSVAWSRRWQLAAWALVSTILGLVLSVLQRFGVAGLIVRAVAGIGWAAATLFAIPLIITEGTMPVATLRRSAGMVRQNLGGVVRSQVRLAAPWVAAMIVSVLLTLYGLLGVVIAVATHDPGSALFVGAVAAIGVTALMFTGATSAALSAYLNAVLFRHITGKPVPGIGSADLPPLPSAT